MKYFSRVSEKEYQVEIDGSEGELSVRLNGVPSKAELKKIGNGGLFSLIVDNFSYELFIEAIDQGYNIWVDGRKHFVEIEDEKTQFIRGLIKSDETAHAQTDIKAPMPGLIVKVLPSEGQQVKNGDGLVIIEAMKMENEIRSNGSGTVRKILVKEKESVEKDTVLMVIE